MNNDELIEKALRDMYDTGVEAGRNKEKLERKFMESVKRVNEYLAEKEQSQAKQDSKWKQAEEYFYISDMSLDIIPNLMGSFNERERGYLNCFKTREQAEIARYCLIDYFHKLKMILKDFENFKNYSFEIKSERGRKVAQELGLDEVKND